MVLRTNVSRVIVSRTMALGDAVLVSTMSRGNCDEGCGVGGCGVRI